MITYFIANEDAVTKQQIPFVAVQSKKPLCMHERREQGCKQANQSAACAALNPKDAEMHATHNRKDERRFKSNGFRNRQRRLQVAI